MSSPSGRAVTLRAADYVAEVVEVGAGLRSLRRAGVDLVAGYSATEVASAGRGQLLLPWPNRVAGGRYSFAGADQQLALTEVPKRNAIHGLTRWVGWSLLEQTPQAATWGHRLWPQPGYPFGLELRVDHRLDDQGLEVTVTATNTGAAAAPYGHGAHPYLTVGRSIDGCELTLPARSRCDTDQRGLPGPAEGVTGGRYDFCRPRLIGGTSFDHPFTDLNRDDAGRVRVVLRDPDSDRSVTLWADASHRWLHVFSGDTLTRRAREALAVEPMTCPPDAFNSGIDLVVLEPGDTHRASFGIT